MEPASVTRPSKRTIGRIAENQPELLNLLVAYFVFEWRSVRLGNPPHGTDQTGMTCLIPNYIRMWTDFDTNGINVAVHLLLRCPESRGMDEPGLLSEFLAECAE